MRGRKKELDIYDSVMEVASLEIVVLKVRALEEDSEVLGRGKVWVKILEGVLF